MNSETGQIKKFSDLESELMDKSNWIPIDEKDMTEKQKREMQVSLHDYRSFVHKNDPKIGRNQPCPCGSGHKFKKCHGRG